MAAQALQLNSCDNVATLMTDAASGDFITVLDISGSVISTFAALERIPRGHKVALTFIDIQSSIKKYGERIGRSKTVIRQGQWVHIHNLESLRGRGDLHGQISSGD